MPGLHVMEQKKTQARRLDRADLSPAEKAHLMQQIPSAGPAPLPKRKKAADEGRNRQLRKRLGVAQFELAPTVAVFKGMGTARQEMSAVSDVVLFVHAPLDQHEDFFQATQAELFELDGSFPIGEDPAFEQQLQGQLRWGSRPTFDLDRINDYQ